MMQWAMTTSRQSRNFFILVYIFLFWAIFFLLWMPEFYGMLNNISCFFCGCLSFVACQTICGILLFWWFNLRFHCMCVFRLNSFICFVVLLNLWLYVWFIVWKKVLNDMFKLKDCVWTIQFNFEFKRSYLDDTVQPFMFLS